MGEVINLYGGNLFNHDEGKENYKHLTRKFQIENIGKELEILLKNFKDSQSDIKFFCYENFKRKIKVVRLEKQFTSQISLYRESLELQRKAFLLYLLELRDMWKEGNLMEDDFLPEIFS